MRAMDRPSDEDRRAYLAMLTGAISRMSTLGFAIKGWGIALAAGLFALGRPDARYQVGVIAVLGCLLLRWADRRIMAIEARFRDHYERVRTGQRPVDFLMDPTRFDDGRRVRKGGGALLESYWWALLALVIVGVIILWTVGHPPETRS